MDKVTEPVDKGKEQELKRSQTMASRKSFKLISEYTKHLAKKMDTNKMYFSKDCNMDASKSSNNLQESKSLEINTDSKTISNSINQPQKDETGNNEYQNKKKLKLTATYNKIHKKLLQDFNEQNIQEQIKSRTEDKTDSYIKISKSCINYLKIAENHEHLDISDSKGNTISHFAKKSGDQQLPSGSVDTDGHCCERDIHDQNLNHTAQNNFEDEIQESVQDRVEGGTEEEPVFDKK